MSTSNSDSEQPNNADENAATPPPVPDEPIIESPAATPEVTSYYNEQPTYTDSNPSYFEQPTADPNGTNPTLPITDAQLTEPLYPPVADAPYAQGAYQPEAYPQDPNAGFAAPPGYTAPGASPDQPAYAGQPQQPYGAPAPGYPAPGYPNAGYPQNPQNPQYPAPGEAYPAPYGGAPGAPNGYGYAAPPAPTPTGLAIAALIVGIVALMVCWIPFLGFLAGATAIVLGIIALRKGQSAGLSISGIITGGLAALAGLLMSILLVVGLTAAGTAISEYESSYPDYTSEPLDGATDDPSDTATSEDFGLPPVATAGSEIRYVATVSSGTATVMYGENFDTAEVSASWEDTETLTSDTYVSMIVTAEDSTATVSCALYIDGVLAHEESSQFIVSCLPE